MKFSQRYGHKPVNQIIQVDSMNGELKNSIWNILHLFVFGEYQINENEKIIRNISEHLFMNHLKVPLDQLPPNYTAQKAFIRELYFRSQWYEVYDLLEAIYATLPDRKKKNLEEGINVILGRELSGFRFINGIITPITDKHEIEFIQQALDDPDFPGVKAHLQSALVLMSDRENPNYRNSIKELISAVENIASIIAKEEKATLGEALTIIEKKGKLHSALKNGFSMLYGYSSDADGIRHAMMDEPNLSVQDAKYFLVTCAAFVNYLKTKI